MTGERRRASPCQRNARNTMAVAFDRDSESTLMTVADAATVAGVHRSLVLAWCRSGALAVRARSAKRGELRIRPADLDAFLAASGTAPDAAPRARTAAAGTDGRRARQHAPPLAA